MPIHLNSISILAEKYPTTEHYPFSLSVLQQTKQVFFNTPVTFFVGENGSGKSTLLEAIAIACGIHIWRTGSNSRYRYNRYEATLHRYIRANWSDGSVPGSFFGAQIFKDFAAILDEWATTDPAQLELFGGKSLITQSHGQSLMSFFKSRYRLKGLYLLDEPETALSPRTQLDLLKNLIDNSRAGHAQFIIATHSPILLACPEATILTFDKKPLNAIDYKNTDHYIVYKDFMMNQEKYLQD